MNSSGSNRWLITLSLIGIIVFIGLNWFPPEGSNEQMPIETMAAISKAQAEAFAKDFISSQYDVGELTAFVIFDSYQDAGGYFLRNKLQPLYEMFWRSSVPIDYFRVLAEDAENAFKFDIYIRMDDGTVFGWESADFPNDPMQANEEIARAMIGHMGFNPADYERLPDSGETELVYRHRQNIGEASLDLHISTQDEMVVGFTPVFELPDSYTAWKTSQDTLGALWSLFSLLLWLGLAIAAIIFMAVYRRTMSFGRGITLTLAFLIPYLLYNVNMYPGIKMNAPGSGGMIVFVILFSQFIMMLMAVSVYLALVSGEGLWRRIFGWNLWPERNEQNFGAEIWKGMGRGYLICFIVLGFQSLLFFLAVKLFDIWSTSDPLQSTHNLLWPALYPLLAWSAAISEEAVFRMFGIVFFAFLFRLLGNRLSRLTGVAFFEKTIVQLIPAVVISNMIWALGHTGYSIYPVYTRFIEVSLLGFIFSYAFLRYGLITAIFAHASMDIIIMGLQIMMGDERYAVLGFLYILMPAAVAALIYLWSLRNNPGRPPAVTGDPSPGSTLP